MFPELLILLFVATARGYQTTSPRTRIFRLSKTGLLSILNREYERSAIPRELSRAIAVGRAKHKGRNQDDPNGGQRMFVNETRIRDDALIVVHRGVTRPKGCTDLFYCLPRFAPIYS